MDWNPFGGKNFTFHCDKNGEKKMHEKCDLATKFTLQYLVSEFRKENLGVNEMLSLFFTGSIPFEWNDVC